MLIAIFDIPIIYNNQKLHHVYSPPKSILFPLNRRRRFGGDVVDDAVDAADFVDDAVRHARQHVVWYARPIGGHRVDRVDASDGARVFVGALVAHDAHALYR